jgi:hypothetical protein
MEKALQTWLLKSQQFWVSVREFSGNYFLKIIFDIRIST